MSKSTMKPKINPKTTAGNPIIGEASKLFSERKKAGTPISRKEAYAIAKTPKDVPVVPMKSVKLKVEPIKKDMVMPEPVEKTKVVRRK